MNETHRAVYFTRNNARIFHFNDLRDLPVTTHVVVDPDLSLVDGIPPHYWKCVNGKILPMDTHERAARDEDHRLTGIDNEVPSVVESHEPSISAFDRIHTHVEELKSHIKRDIILFFFLLVLIMIAFRFLK